MILDALETADEPLGRLSGSPGVEVGTKTGPTAGEMDTSVTPRPLHDVQSATGTEMAAANAAATLA